MQPKSIGFFTGTLQRCRRRRRRRFRRARRACPEPTLHTECRAPTEGANPLGEVFIDESGALYGTTEYGGRHDRGSVYKLTPPPNGSLRIDWKLSVLFSFLETVYWAPMGGLVRDKHGAFYGVTSGGGNSDCHCAGSVFKLTPPAAGNTQWDFKVLHSFKSNNPSDPGGSDPDSTLLLRDDVLYGATVQGGDGGGVIFSVDLKTQKFSVLHRMDGTGEVLNSTLIADSKGALYGVAGFDVVHFSGAVFKLSPPPTGMTTWTVKVLHTFTGKPHDGTSPYGGLVRGAGGVLYGTTGLGGSKDLGTIFSLKP